MMADAPEKPAPEQPAAEKPAPPPPAPPRRWSGSTPRPDPARAGDPPATGAGCLMVLLIVMLLGTIGAAVAWWFYPSPCEKVTLLRLPVADYLPPLPANAFAVQDSNALADSLPERTLSQTTTQGRRLFTLVLDGLDLTREGVVVFHVSALARGNGKDVDIVPALPAGDLADTVPLQEVLDALRKCPAPHKLLLLDVGRPIGDAQAGSLADDVAELVHQQLEREDKRKKFNFFVLTACERGAQVSLASEELQLSVFAYFVAHGLHGAADGQGPQGKIDRDISVTELAAYVRDAVDRWAQQNRATRQTPKLWGSVKDFSLVCSKLTHTTSPPNVVEDLKYPGWLYAAWELRDRWWKDETYRLYPHEFREMEKDLLRWEHHWRAGRPLEDEAKSARVRWERLQPAKRPVLPASLPADTAGADAKTIEGLQGALRRHLLEQFTIPKDSTPEEDKMRAAKLKKDRAALVEQLGKQPYPLATLVIFDLAAKLPEPAPEHLEYLQALHLDRRNGAADGEVLPSYAEVALLDRIKIYAAQVRKQGLAWPVAAVRRAMDVAQTAEQTLARLADEPVAVTWAGASFRQGDAQRAKGEARLLSAEQPEHADEAMRFLVAADGHYRKAGEYIEVVADMRRRRDHGYAVLPGWALWLGSRYHPSGEEPGWQEYVTSTRALAALLADSKSVVDPEPQPLAMARSKGRTYQKRLAEEIDRGCKLSKEAPPADYRRILALLDTPLPSAPQRKELWEKAHAIAAQLMQARPPTQPVLVDELTDLTAEYRRARRRALRSLDLLTLAGYDGTAALREKYEAAVEKNDPAELQGLGMQFARTWGQLLPRLLDAPKLPLAHKDALARIAGAPNHAAANATKAIWDQALEDFARLLRGRPPSGAKGSS